MLIRDLFRSDVTRDIPPVVYFHEQTPSKLAAEVSEYIITGGWPEDHPNHKRVPSGIHESYVRLITNITRALDKTGGPELPNAWISGFYGSGKSSFAKLLGLALDDIVLPGDVPLADAWLARDTSPRAQELRDAWAALRARIEPISVVFDIGAVARDNEHIHAAAIRQLQRRLGYCSTNALVADFELTLERDGSWEKFVTLAEDVLGVPWSEAKDRDFAEEEFSLVMSELRPDLYRDPMAWFMSRAGTHTRSESPEEAVQQIGDMVRFRRPGATVFFVIDEVSQYVVSNKDRADRLRAFATALGAGLRGKAWLLALGQQKLDDQADASFLVWVKDRFQPSLRVHLAATNIRDVVHKRLLHKTPEAADLLRARFEKHRPDLKLYAYDCETITADAFVEVYPLLPGHIDLLLQITSALRSRSSRAQGDDQAIRGLLQLLGELFRGLDLADEAVGTLVTLDQIYAVQQTALDADVQSTMARILDRCKDDEDGPLMVRAAKAVALLELIQDTLTTDAKLVAQVLYDRLDRGDQTKAIQDALEKLRRRNLLGYSERTGYKIQSSAGEEWERERRDINVSRDALNALVRDALKLLVADTSRPRYMGRNFPWVASFTDRRDDPTPAVVVDSRDDAVVRVDLRYLIQSERIESEWIHRSDESAHRDHLLWLSGDRDPVERHARDLARSRDMIQKYKPRRASLSPARKLLLQQEENRAEDLLLAVRKTVAEVWMSGRLYFRGRALKPNDQGAAFASALEAAGNRVLPDLFPHFASIQILPSELAQLLAADLSGVSPKLLADHDQLGVLELDSGRYVASCSGVVPRRVFDQIKTNKGVSGTQLLAHFGRPPYGYTANVVKACVAGLLRGGRVRVQPDSGAELTAIRDAGAKALFERDRDFRRAAFHPNDGDGVTYRDRAKIAKFFKKTLSVSVEREDHAIADAIMEHFPRLSRDLRAVFDTLRNLGRSAPPRLGKLAQALDTCVQNGRNTLSAVRALLDNLDTLQDGVPTLQTFRAEINDDALSSVRSVAHVLDHQAQQLADADALTDPVRDAIEALRQQLGQERPWSAIASAKPHIATVCDAYVRAREDMIAWQGKQAEAARNRLKQRRDFGTLEADESFEVLRPIARAITATRADTLTPPLVQLKDPFLLILQRAERQANAIFDELIAIEAEIVPLDPKLKNRELHDAGEVDTLLDELRERILAHIRDGKHVRLT